MMQYSLDRIVRSVLLKQQLFTIGEIVDPVMAVMAAQIPELDRALRQGVQQVQDTNVSRDRANRTTEQLLMETGDSMRRNSLAAGEMFGTVNIATRGMAEFSQAAFNASQLGLRSQEQQAQGARSVFDSVKDLMNTTDALTNATTQAQVAFKESAKTLMNDVNPLLQDFAVKGLGSVKGLVETITEADKKIRQSLYAISRVRSVLRGERPLGEPEPEPGPAAGSTFMGETSPAFAQGGIARGPDSGYAALLHGTEAVIPLPNARSVPVDLSIDVNNLSRAFNENFASAMSAYNKAMQQPVKAEVNIPAPEIAGALSTALETTINNPSGLTAIMSAVRQQLADSTQQQLSVMQQQIDKMDQMVSTMQENVRYSERIANELG